jgi:hypothetical protein
MVALSEDADSPLVARVWRGGIRGVCAGRTGVGFSKLGVTSAASTEVLAGEVATVFSFDALAVEIYMGTTKISTARVLSFTDGDGGTVIGTINIPVTDEVSNFVLHHKVLFDPAISLTSGNGLFAVLSGALGTSGMYNVMSIVWKA